MLPSLLRKLHEISRRLVVRVLLIAFLAVVAVALSKALSLVIPPGLDGLVGAEAVDNILSIIANSMLTVTTFSLTVMTAAHRLVSTNWTPRAHQSLRQDTLTHTVLATFVGAYLYALLAIVLRDMDLFRGEELVVLFGTTLLVVLMIVIAIIRWISHLETLGSLDETGARIEAQTREAWQMRCAYPTLGAQPFNADTLPEGVQPVAAAETGYLRQIYQDLLQKAASDHDTHVWVPHQIGAMVFRGQPLAYTDSTAPDLHKRIRETLVQGPRRNFEQDPGHGLICLSEIAVRALSPGVNDPGTARDMLYRVARIVMARDTPPTPTPPDSNSDSDTCLHDRIFLPRLDSGALLARTLVPILHDWDSRPELTGPMAEVLDALRAHPDPAIAAEAAGLHRRAFAPDAATGS